ncbi:hypothetical protein [Haloarchaeobius baliensis]|uniref:hypothetical protein n=1 Tax=Haloarchaeobius baliensis TaxID=1670458 RepID=UPI003F882855
MNTELFGVFGDATDLRSIRDTDTFDRVLAGPRLAVGVSDEALGHHGRTRVHQTDSGCCVVWGEAYLPEQDAENPAAWLLERYQTDGADAVGELNGSYVVTIDVDEQPIVVSDPVRSWECFHTDVGGTRVFGTDPTEVVATDPDPTVHRQSLLEFLHMGVVLGDRTLYESVDRVPFDGYLTADASGLLDRFVYEPRRFDYVDSLADRLERAIDRRRSQPGRSGVLLSAGYDSRLFLSELDDLERCYTVGRPESDEVRISSRIADQYGVPHSVIDPDGGYMNTDGDTIQYGGSIREALHVHHENGDDGMAVDSVYHGLLFDTFLSAHFRPERSTDVFGLSIPRRGLDPDPDLAETLLFEKFGFWQLDELLESVEMTLPEDSVSFCREALEEQRDRHAHRFDSEYNAIPMVGIQNQPTLSFRNHLADQYVESFVAADSELLAWHLQTPPEHRSRQTYLDALERVDDDLLRHRPPDRPRKTFRRNQIEKTIRRAVPGVKSFETPWPDRKEHYRRERVDERFLADAPSVHDLPPRVKLRFMDVRCWLNDLSDSSVSNPVTLLG